MASSVRDHLHVRLEALLADCDPVMNSADFGQTIHDLDECLPCRLIKARNGTQRNDRMVQRIRFNCTDPVIALYFIPGFCFAKGKCGKKLYGESELAKEWSERMRMVLLSEGFVGMECELLMLRKGLKTKRRKVVDSLSHNLPPSSTPTMEKRMLIRQLILNTHQAGNWQGV